MRWSEILIARNKPAEALAAIQEEPDESWREFALPIAYDQRDSGLVEMKR